MILLFLFVEKKYHNLVFSAIEVYVLDLKEKEVVLVLCETL